MPDQGLSVAVVPNGAATCLDQWLGAICDFLSKKAPYDFVSTRKTSAIPAGIACVVKCTADGVLCLAFAVHERGRVAWFGVTAKHQEPVELRDVRGYVVVDDGLRSMVLGVSNC